MQRARAGWVLSGWLLAGSFPACKHPPPSEGAAFVEAGTAPPDAPSEPPLRSVEMAFIDDVAHTCVFGNQGTVLDFGDPNLEAHFGPKLVPPPLEIIEREGATWARIRARSLPVDFYVAPPAATPPKVDGGETSFLEAHVRGGAAKTATFYVNGKLVGTSTLVKNVARVVSFNSPNAALALGNNQLLIRFAGAPKGNADPAAEIDWVHIGSGEESPTSPVALRSEAKVSATILGKAARALSFRSGGYARCSGFLLPGGTFEAALGMSGEGSADAEIRLLRDRAPPVVLGDVHLEGADREGKAVSFPLGDVGEKGTLGAIEMWATRSTRGARLLFGEPKITGSLRPSTPRPPPVRGVVLVVFGNVATRGLALYGGRLRTPELSRLASRGVTFDANRATTVLEEGSFASMLTGLSPRDHGVKDPEARLPKTLTTFADAARQAGIPTAFFTANPTADQPFGFDRGWSTFEAEGPLETSPHPHVFERASAWITEHKAERFVVVVYAQGGHPPWNISADDVKGLEPAKYVGGMDPKHAGELLGHPGRALSEDDRVRAWAMYDFAMTAEDAAFGRLLGSIAGAGRATDTAILVTGDVGVDGKVPFEPPKSLDESVLWTPLVLGLPGGEFAGTKVSAPTTGQDLARTVLSLLGLSSPETFGGVDLVDLAANRTSSAARPLISLLGDRFALRWGSFVELGQRETEGRMCDLSLEPDCITDVTGTYPLAASLLHGQAFDFFVAHKSHPPPREPAILDKEARDALRAWGR